MYLTIWRGQVEVFVRTITTEPVLYLLLWKAHAYLHVHVPLHGQGWLLLMVATVCATALAMDT